MLPAGECIRATAIGASEYSVQLSGNTIYISSPGELLPRKNLQVVQPPFVCGEAIVPAELAQSIHDHFMRVVAPIEDRRVIRRILEHLGRWAPQPAGRGPPVPAPEWPANAVTPLTYRAVPDIA